MARRARFTLVDVFTGQPFGGNQLAVFCDATEITSAEMQLLARELNFSESTFVTASDDPAIARRVRIFTPRREIPMAGHPTIGTGWVLANRGFIAVDSAVVDVTLGLGVGPVTISICAENHKPRFVWMKHRAAMFGAIRSDRHRVAKALGLEPAELRSDLPTEIVSTGFPFLLVPVTSSIALGRCAPNETALADLFAPNEARLPVYIFAVLRAGNFGVRARMFAPHTDGIPEDPATGSAAGPLGAYAAKHHLIPDSPELGFIVDQGVEMKRPSQIHVEVKRGPGDAIRIRIGGQCAVVGEGEITLP